ncbi:MAG: VanZ family protein [Chloroflexota bacterium]
MSSPKRELAVLNDIHPTQVKNPTKLLDRYIRQWRLGLFASSLLVVLGSSLFPYSLDYEGDTATLLDWWWWVDQFYIFGPVEDALIHFIFFIPFGFGWAMVLHPMRRWPIGRHLLFFFGCFSISFLLEASQTLIPGRTSSMMEGMANLAGSLCGYWVLYHWGIVLLSWINKTVIIISVWLTPRGMLIGFVIYVNIVMVIVLVASQKIDDLISFHHWGNYDLVLGNERTGRRPWHGQLFNVMIFDHALSTEQVAELRSSSAFLKQERLTQLERDAVTSYRFQGPNPFQDRTNNLSDMVWHGPFPPIPADEGVIVDDGSWLRVRWNPEGLLWSLRDTAQMTLIATFAPANLTQSGPARIVSYAHDTRIQNFTLGQSGADLVFRVRTPATGWVGRGSELIIPNVFIDKNKRQIIATYKAGQLNVYVDGHLSPKALVIYPSFAQTLQLSFSGLFFSQSQTSGFLVIAHALIFFCFSIFMAYATSGLEGGSHTFTLIFGVSTLIVPVLVVGFIAYVYKHPVSVSHLLLAIALTALFILLILGQIALWQKYRFAF